MKVLQTAYKSVEVIRAAIKRRIFACTLGHVGTGTSIDPTVIFEFPEKIWVGDRCILHRGAKLVGVSHYEIGICLGDGTKVHENAFLNSYSGRIICERNVYIGHGSIVCGHGGLFIGENTMISGLCYVIPANHIFTDVDIPLRFQGETRRGIRVGRNAWIGAGSVILDGVTVGDSAVVGAGAVVSRDIPPWAVAMGVPAKVVRYRRQ